LLNSSIRYLGTWHAPDITPGKPGWDHAALVD